MLVGYILRAEIHNTLLALICELNQWESSSPGDAIRAAKDAARLAYRLEILAGKVDNPIDLTTLACGVFESLGQIYDFAEMLMHNGESDEAISTCYETLEETYNRWRFQIEEQLARAAAECKIMAPNGVRTIELERAIGMGTEEFSEMSEIQLHEWQPPQSSAEKVSQRTEIAAKIPQDKRTKAMSKTEALNYIKWPKYCENLRQARNWLNKSIEDGEYRCEETSSRTKFVWHLDDFPVECRDEIRKV